MNSIPPQFVALFCIMFISLGIFSILTARRRRRQAVLQGEHLPWYRQTALLTGIEYILLAAVFLISLGISYKVLPVSLNGVLVPILLLLILASGLFAGFIVYQNFANMRRRRQLATSGAGVATNGNISGNGGMQTSQADMTPQERAVYAQKRRDRRQKAAAARRRRAGKA